MDTLDSALLHPTGESGPNTIKRECNSVAFLVNGLSLFEAMETGGRGRCGCVLVPGAV